MRILNRIAASIAVATALVFGISAQAKSPSVADLSWLSGCWQLTRDGAVTDETWMKPQGGLMLGTSRTVTGGKAVWFEQTRIAEEKGTIVFIARPYTTDVDTTFPMKSKTATEIVFENDGHDFPQLITYRRSGANGLFARIEGMQDGKKASQDFQYKRVECE